MYYGLFKRRRDCFKNIAYPRSCATNEEPFEISKIGNLSKILHPDDFLPLYQNKGERLKIPSYNRHLKELARSQNQQKIQNVKKYCENEIPQNKYLRLANEHVEDRNKFLYFDFNYNFLYCQTQKVIYFKNEYHEKSNISKK